MKIAVIAANGKSGKLFVDQALNAGHVIKAGVHRSNNLTAHPNLSVITCDATKQSDLIGLIHEVDAVASFIGHVKGSPPYIQRDAIKVLISAMLTEGINRIVSLTGTGVRFANDKITPIDIILNATIKIIDPARVNDGIAHVEELKKSDLDWTVLRVLKLHNGRPMPFTLREHGPTKLFVSRSEVAQASLQVLENGEFIKQAPIISKV